jgi:hypothetical protein
MTPELHSFQLPLSETEAYIKEVLADSRRSLGRQLLSAVDLTQGKVFTWAFARAQIPADLSRGGLLKQPDPSTWLRGEGSVAVPLPSTSAKLASEILDFISHGSGKFCLVANENVDPGDPVSAKYPAKAVYREELYHLITHGMDRDEVARVLSAAMSVPTFFGVLSSSLSVLPTQSLSEGFFRAVLENIEALFVGAFDGEGFLIWQRSLPSDS